MPRIAELEIGREPSEEEVSEVETDEQGRTAHEVIADSFSDMLDFDDEEPAVAEQEEEEEEITDEEVEETDEEEEETTDSEEDTEEEEEEEEEPETPASKDYSAIKAQLSEVYGEEDLETPEQIEQAISDIINERNSLNGDKETFEAVTGLFQENDEIVQVAKYLKEGYTFNEALARVIDFEDWQEELKENDPDEYKKVVKRQMEREKAKELAEEKRKEREEKMAENRKKSNKNWEAFAEARFASEDGEVDEKQAQKFADQINSQIQNVADGNVSEEFLEIFYKGLNYEKAVQDAMDEGEKSGKNKKITAEKTKKQGSGDGLPKFKGGSKKQPASKRKGEDPFDVALKPRKRLADY